MEVGQWLGALGATGRHLAETRRRRAPLVFLDQRWAHHGRRSGYLIAGDLGPTLSRFDRVLPRRLVRAWSERSGDPHWEERWLLWASLALGGARLVHVVDGDFDRWAYAPRPHWLRTRVTATFHQPIDRLAEVTRSIRPGALDGIVCMSRAQIPLLEHLVAPGRCVFIPHGVETEFFRPADEPDPRRPPLLLSVGAHRRDFATLVSAARAIRARRTEVIVRLIAPQPAADAVRRDAGGALEVLSGISDEELRAQYQAAALLLLPLEAATANNALLEAMACGRPSVISDIADLRDYATGEAAVFCARGDSEAHAAGALALLGDRERCARMGLAARRQAESLAWPLIRARAGEFFRSVAAGD
ncbi:MAG: glycosyltransferase [Myxococcota bacterium]